MAQLVEDAHRRQGDIKDDGATTAMEAMSAG
jgi:hypothetical protein